MGFFFHLVVAGVEKPKASLSDIMSAEQLDSKSKQSAAPAPAAADEIGVEESKS